MITAINSTQITPRVAKNNKKNTPEQPQQPVKSLSMPKNLSVISFTGNFNFVNQAKKYMAYDFLKGEIPHILPEKDCSRAYKRHADFSGRDLSGINLEKSSFFSGNFSKIKLSATNFENAMLRTSIFTDATMGNDTIFRNADLVSCDFSGVTRQGKVNMERANVMNATFNTPDALSFNFRHAFYNEHTRFPEGFDPERFKMIEIKNGANLSQAALNLKAFNEMDKVNFDKAKFRLTEFKGINFTETSMKRMDLKQSYIYKCKMDKADLTRSYLREAEIIDSSLKKASMKQVNLHKATLKNTDMTETDLRGAILTWKEASNVNLRGATYDDVTQFNPGFNPQAHGMVKVATNMAAYGYSK